MHTPRHALPLFSTLIAVAWLLSACSATAPVTQAGPSKPTGSGACVADKVQWAVGKPGDQATMGRVWRESGAGLIRPISPNQAVTHDFRADRVNVQLDAKNLITQVTCG